MFLILTYFKCYPTLDVLGLLLDLDGSNACRNVQKLTPILEHVLGKKMVLPSRKISSVKGLLEIFPGVKELFIDGTERPLQRPKDEEKQKKNYSGKKKAHTRKNIVITDKNKRIGFLCPDKNKRIGFLCPPEEGKRHDYNIFKDIFPPGLFPKSILLWLDLAFIGIDKDCPEASVMMPKKKPRGQN